ncbi:MAG: B12-binding domain-containing radical SAM protein [Bryobacteraceae bacterium]
MNICLVSSPTVTEFDPQVAKTDAVRVISEHAPIGILTLAAILGQSRVTVEVVDLNQTYYRYLRSAAYRRRVDFCSFVAREFASRSFDLWGFSTICSTFPLTIRIARELKRSQPQSVVMLGGPQASVVDAGTLRAFPFIDFIVRGEADETLPRLLAAFPDLREIPGVTFRSGGNIVRNPNAPVVLDLDKLPLPAFDRYPGLDTCQAVPLELGRGCPFACNFCSTNDFFRRRFRLKSPACVIEQMRMIHRTYGNTRFELIHDMFTVDRKRVVEFCEALLASGEQFQWNCSARTDCIDEALIALMAQAGCAGIFFGIETGSARMQRLIGKNLDLREAASRIGCTVRRGIGATVSLITGFPGETRQDLRDTVDFLMDAARLDGAAPQLHLLAPLAGTPIYEQYRGRLEQADIFSDISYHGWRQDAADQELIRAHPDIFPNFYSVPSSLDLGYLKELRGFILDSMLRCRWLVVALHQDSGGLLGVFDDWLGWLKENRPTGREAPDKEERPYYARVQFAQDLREFVRNRYLRRAGNRGPSALARSDPPVLSKNDPLGR